MKNPSLHTRAFERLYQKMLRLLREDEAKFDADPAVDFEKRAKEFIASMSTRNQVLLAVHVHEHHGLDALDELSWVMPQISRSMFELQAALDEEIVVPRAG